MAQALKYPVNDPEPILTLTRPKDHIWVIELHNGQDNRLTPRLIDHSFKPALDEVERQWRERWREAAATKKPDLAKGALIIVGRRDQDKFFSNGLDFAVSSKDMNFFPVTFDPMLKRLLTFPIPTVAAINGHCFAGGLMLSLACDYRVMTDGRKRNAWLCMNEVHFGARWPLSFAAILRAKFGDHRLQRKIALEGHRFVPSEALAAGILDYIVEGKTADVLAKAEEVAEVASANARAGVWGLIKNDLYRDTVRAIEQETRLIDASIEDAAAKARL
ncbi:ClpP/crotonase [Coprinopsis marcescibilis]|uniref:ClpP/crotonase n=1 Tax=Coprinopsis marcescibilis TaxID=230819 RepID=A0A5C3L3B0_COPMA|nr:ClpP/crotonase [Coprinopsis marcescibilis]